MIWTIHIIHGSGDDVYMFSSKQKALDYVKENIHKHAGYTCWLEHRTIDNPECELEDHGEEILLVTDWRNTGEPVKWYY